MATRRKSAVVTTRPRHTIALPAATVGFSNLVEPDDYDESNPQFKVNLHLSPEAVKALVGVVDDKVYTEKNLGKLAEEAEEAGMASKKKPMPDPIPAEDWVGDKLKDPKPESKVQLPYIIIGQKADYKKDGELVRREMKAWDANNKPLPLKNLRLGMGSVVEAIVSPNLYFNKLQAAPAPSLKLVGIRVLKLVQFGGGSAPADTDDNAIKEVLGEDFEADDLSKFAQSASQDEDAPPADSGDEAPEKELF